MLSRDWYLSSAGSSRYGGTYPISYGFWYGAGLSKMGDLASSKSCSWNPLCPPISAMTVSSLSPFALASILLSVLPFLSGEDSPPLSPDDDSSLVHLHVDVPTGIDGDGCHQRLSRVGDIPNPTTSTTAEMMVLLLSLGVPACLSPASLKMTPR
jgi:hypothetical protein